MIRIPRLLCSILLLAFFLAGLLSAQVRQNMPKEDIIDVKAIGDVLCVSNVFQSNMVLQRDKPISIWGWADVGEEVSVTIGGNSQLATAAKNRKWKVSLPAMTANSKPQTLTVKGANKSLTLENILIGDVWVLQVQRFRAF